MKKNKSPKISPEEAIRFLDDMRKLTHEKDEPTISISIRLPSNILRSVKLKAKADGKKYQSLIVEYVRKGLSEG
jgi:predicted DNA binding CopG/RHH family protein